MNVIEPLSTIPPSKNDQFVRGFNKCRGMIGPRLRNLPPSDHLRPGKGGAIERVQIVQILPSVAPPEDKDGMQLRDIIGRVHVARSWRRAGHSGLIPPETVRSFAHVEDVQVRCGEGATAEPSAQDEDLILDEGGGVAVAARGSVPGNVLGEEPGVGGQVEQPQRRVVPSAIVAPETVEVVVVVAYRVVFDGGCGDWRGGGCMEWLRPFHERHDAATYWTHRLYAVQSGTKARLLYVETDQASNFIDLSDGK